MSSNKHARTLSQALLNLGRIRSVEDSIIFGSWGLHKARDYKHLEREEREEVERHLQDLRDFCESFKLIVSVERRGSQDLEVLLEENFGIETTDRINELSGIYLISSKDDRKNQITAVRYIEKTVERVLEGKVNLDEVEKSLKRLKKLRNVVRVNSESEKRQSERIISGRPLIM